MPGRSTGANRSNELFSMRPLVKRLTILGLVLLALFLSAAVLRGYRSLNDSVKSSLPEATIADRTAIEDRAERVSKLFGSEATIAFDWVSFEPEIVGGHWTATIEGAGDASELQEKIVQESGTLSGPIGTRLLDGDLFSFVIEPIDDRVLRVSVEGPSRMKSN